MSPLLATGITTIFLALGAYTAGVVAIERDRQITGWTAAVLTVGLALDATATACMVAISNGPLTLHGWVGILALAIMAALIVFAWRHRRARWDDPSSRKRDDGRVPHWLHRYVWIAYLLWLAAFIMGIVLGTSSR